MQLPSQPDASGRAPLGFVEAGLLAALGATLFESWRLDWALGPTFVVAALLAALAVATAAVLTAQEALVARIPGRPWARSAIRASGALLVFVPTAARSFDGAFASTLPGASTAFVWLPVLAWAGTTAVLRLAARFAPRSRAAQRRRAAVFAAAAIGVEVVGRNFKSSEHPDAHTALVVVALVLGLLAIRSAVARPVRARQGAVATWLAAATLFGLTWCLRVGLQDPEDRWRIATHGTTARLLVRAARELCDLDGDGHAALLAGGDCDDADPARSPDAVESVGDDVDEDCDGVAVRADPTLDRARAQWTADLESWAAGPEASQLRSRTRELDIVLIAVDALRADALAPNARNRTEFPHLSALVDGSTAFDRAFAPAAGTDLSMSTILTGRIDPFSEVPTTLTEALAATGRTTFGVIPSEVLRYAGRALLTRGLSGHQRLVNDRFERDVGSYSTSRRATQLALEWLAARPADERVFLWVHYFDVHEHDELEAGGKLGREDRYRAAVALVDAAVGELLDGLSATGRLDRAIVVLVSDHGEGLGEDPRLPENHGLFVYNPLVHVPLAIRIPGLAGRRVTTPISLVDLAPTLADLAGATLPGADGTSLLPQLHPAAPADLRDRPRPIILNESDQYGVIDWPLKLMQRPADRLVELYDLETDFAEAHDLAEARPDVVERLLTVYHAHPRVVLDRTRKGRRLRELAAQGE
jgi:hypothetical protein